MKKVINKTLFKYERKNNLLSLIIFTSIVSLLVLMVCALYPTLKDAMTQLPEELSELINFNNVRDYFNTEAMEIWVLIGCFYAVYLAVKLTSENFKNNSFEMLYTLNMSRKEIALTKLSRLIINLSIYNFVVGIVSFFGLWLFCKEILIVPLLAYLLYAWITTLIIGFIMFGWGLLGKKRFNAILGIVVVFLLFIISNISISSAAVEWLGYLSPFTSLYGNVMSEGFGGLLNYGASLIIWGFVSIGLLILNIIQFKNIDLD